MASDEPVTKARLQRFFSDFPAVPISGAGRAPGKVGLQTGEPLADRMADPRPIGGPG